MKDKIFEEFEHRGITDDDVGMKHKQVIREIDRDIENETSKNEKVLIIMQIEQWWLELL